MAMENKYDFIIKDMTWSYSRIKSFSDCKYMWFLKYVMGCDTKRLYFSDYGKFMHSILEMYLTKVLTKEELVDYYISNFYTEVLGKCPSSKIYGDYFNKCLTYLQTIDFPRTQILSVENKIEFNIGGHPCIGYVDVISKDDGISITDHKSRDLKPRSNRAKPIKSDLELDEYLKQLYIYSIYVKEHFGEYPKNLEFNCFKANEFIVEPFNLDTFNSTKEWALQEIEKITNNGNWRPSLDFWRCNHLCDVCDSCEYKKMM